MSISDIFKHFDKKSKLWIDVNEVRDQVCSLGFSDEIKFHFVNLDEAKVRGFIHRWSYRPGVYADPVFASDIYIAKTLDQDWRRVVAVKELLHIADSEKFTAASREAVHNLLEKMALPFEVREAHRPSHLNDRIRLISAISVLVPRVCREHLRRLYSQASVTESEIALMARIPVRFVHFILSDEFDKIVDGLHDIENDNNA